MQAEEYIAHINNRCYARNTKPTHWKETLFNYSNCSARSYLRSGLGQLPQYYCLSLRLPHVLLYKVVLVLLSWKELSMPVRCSFNTASLSSTSIGLRAFIAV